MLTYDNIKSLQGMAHHPGEKFEFGPVRARGYKIYDAEGVVVKEVKTSDRVYDSTGAFLVGELERLDQTMHMPLAAVTYTRDLDLREDVTPADEVSSFTVTSFGSAGGAGTGNQIGNGKSWAGKESTQITNAQIDIAKVTQPLNIWSQEVKFSIPGLVSAAQLGRPIDAQKIEALLLKHQMDADEQAYYGDTGYATYGLLRLNNRTDQGQVTSVQAVANGSGGTPQWINKAPQEIMTDVNTALSTVWQASAWAMVPTDILIPPAQYTDISNRLVSQAGNTSVLDYILKNNLLTKEHGKQLSIRPVKWAIGAGVGGTIGTLGTVDRMCVYTRDQNRIRFPLTQLSRTPVQYEGLFHKFTYWGRLGVVEPVYPEMVGYFDGL